MYAGITAAKVKGNTDTDEILFFTSYPAFRNIPIPAIFAEAPIGAVSAGGTESSRNRAESGRFQIGGRPLITAACCDIGNVIDKCGKQNRSPYNDRIKKETLPPPSLPYAATASITPIWEIPPITRKRPNNRPMVSKSTAFSILPINFLSEVLWRVNNARNQQSDTDKTVCNVLFGMKDAAIRRTIIPASNTVGP